MDKQKQIEEMAKVIEEAMAKARRTLGGHNNIAMFYATMLTNAGYRKIQEGAVVFIPTEEKYALLTKEEYERWQGQTLNVKKVRKETAEKFAERLKSRFDKSREYYTIDTGTAWGEGQIGGLINDKIDEICKEITEGNVNE